jgi:hypothetical protein
MPFCRCEKQKEQEMMRIEPILVGLLDRAIDECQDNQQVDRPPGRPG